MKDYIKIIEERGEFGPLEDGYIYWFPSGNGAVSSDLLRLVADELDARNKEWDEFIREDLKDFNSEEGGVYGT